MSLLDFTIEFFQVWLNVFSQIWERLPDKAKIEIVIVFAIIIFGRKLLKLVGRVIGNIFKLILEDIRIALR